MSCERALNFDHRKKFSENYKTIRVWLWFVYKFTENNCRLRLFSEFYSNSKLFYLPWQNMYSNLKTSCHSTNKLSSVAFAKNTFTSVYVVGINYFDGCLLFRVIPGRYFFLYKSSSLLQKLCCCSLCNKCFERSPYFTLSLQWQCIVFVLILQTNFSFDDIF